MSVLDAIRWYAERGAPANVPPVTPNDLAGGTAATRAVIDGSPGYPGFPENDHCQRQAPGVPSKTEKPQRRTIENEKPGEPRKPAIQRYPPVFKVNLADRPKEWLTLIGCADIQEAEYVAHNKFGTERVLAVVAYFAPKKEQPVCE